MSFFTIIILNNMTDNTKMMIYDFATEATKKAMSMNVKNPGETIAFCTYLQKEIIYIVERESEKVSKVVEEPTDINKALDIAMNYGNWGGEHHLIWCIDQMVRSLTNCPTEIVKTNSGNYERLGESDEYKKFKELYSEDRECHDWDSGIAP